MWAGETECAPGMPTWSPERYAISVRPDTAKDDAIGFTTIDGDQGIDSCSAIAEKVFHAAQVTEPFLADITDKEYVGLRPDPGFLQRTQHP